MMKRRNGLHLGLADPWPYLKGWLRAAEIRPIKVNLWQTLKAD